MHIPTPSGVIEAAVSLPGSRAVFGTLDLSGESVILEPCSATTEPCSGGLVEILGMEIPASTEIALADRTWRAAGTLEQGDEIIRWAQGTGVMESYVLPELTSSNGDATRIVAPFGCLLGPSESGPWILVR